MSESKSTSNLNQNAYDQWSSFYNAYPNPTVALDDLTFPAFWRDVIDLRVLEIGCGTGRHTRRLLAQGNHVTGIDSSKGMLEKARSTLSGMKLDLIHADILSYDGFQPGSFDAIVSALVIEHIEDVDRLFELISRLLKPGGEFFLSEIHPDRTAQGIAAHFVDPNSGEEVHLRSLPHTEQGIRRAAGQACLAVQTCETIRGSEALAKLNSKWQRYLGQPMIQIWKLRKSAHPER